MLLKKRPYKIRNHTWISVNNKFNFLAILYLESLKMIFQ